MNYTTDQQRAVDSLLRWYKGEKTGQSEYGHMFLLNGAAGTGKTTVAKEVIKMLGLKSYQLAVTAPTQQVVVPVAEVVAP